MVKALYLRFFLFFTVITGLIISCANENQKIFLDHSANFVLPKGVAILPTDKYHLDFFLNAFNKNQKTPLVLYKVLKAPDFKIFISIGIDTQIDSICKNLENRGITPELLKQRMAEKSIQMLQKIDSGRYVCHFIKEFPTGNKYVFSYVGNKKEVIDEVYTSNEVDLYIEQK